MEAQSAKQPLLVGRLPTKKLLRLASEERLVALTRAGNQRAFEVLIERYRSRLLAFCRHMLGSKEDAEDVLQEVFVSAYNALVADDRPINVRPWLYRIARNRCLNELRRTTPSGVDSMDVYLGADAESVSDRILQKERVRHLVEDIGQLPESQRTALLLRELDDLSYEQIAEAMETTVPSVKSLLVRARVALAEAAEARALSCEEVREKLGEEAEGLAKLSAPYRRHLRACESCRAFRKQLRRNDRLLAALLPVGLIPAIQRLLIAHLPESSNVVGAGSAAGAVGASAGSSGLGSLLGVGGGAVVSKAAAGLATAAIVAAGAVAAEQTIHHPPHKALAKQSHRTHGTGSSGDRAPQPPADREPPLPPALAVAPAGRTRVAHTAGRETAARTTSTSSSAQTIRTTSSAATTTKTAAATTTTSHPAPPTKSTTTATTTSSTAAPKPPTETKTRATASTKTVARSAAVNRRSKAAARHKQRAR